MKNVVMVKVDGRPARLYAVPMGVTIERGTEVLVETLGGALHGVTTCDAVEMFDETLAYIRRALDVPADARLKRVLTVYTSTEMVYPDEEPAAAGELIEG